MCLASLKLEGLRIVDWNLKMQIQTLNLKMAITCNEILVDGSGEKYMLKVTLVAMDWCFRSKKVQMVAIIAKVDVTFDHSSLNVNI